MLERADADGAPAEGEGAGLQLRGYGESSDAHHMSTPHPQGLGAQLAMRDALARAGIAPDEVGYLNLHGTATPANDSVEALAVSALFPESLHASSTKGWTGHTLGAAGIVESVFALLALEHGELPGILNSTAPDPACGLQIRFDNAQRGIRYSMNNSFGFGGNNCSLVFGLGMSVRMLQATIEGIGFWAQRPALLGGGARVRERGRARGRRSGTSVATTARAE